MYIPELYIIRAYLDNLLIPKAPYLQDDNDETFSQQPSLKTPHIGGYSVASWQTT